MILIKHRVNSLKILKNLPKIYGIELDIRSLKNQITIGHEPFNKSQHLKKLIKYYKHRFVIFDMKEEGLEPKVLQLIKRKKIKNYFFLNVNPSRINFFLKKRKKINLCLRLSKIENVKNIQIFKGRIKWIWIDTFDNKIPLKANELQRIHKTFNLCLVSPELVPTNNISINKFAKNNQSKIKFFSAICSKKLFLWEKILD